MPGVVNATNMTRYENLTNTDIETLLQDGPLAVAVFANAGFMSYTSGVYTGCPDSATSISSINHAVIVVGMDANKNYIIKNSWEQVGENQDLQQLAQQMTVVLTDGFINTHGVTKLWELFYYL